MITAPCAASRRDTSLLPDPMPPVSPTRSTAPAFPLGDRSRSILGQFAARDAGVLRQRGTSRAAIACCCDTKARERKGGARNAGAAFGAAGLTLAAGQLLAQGRQGLVGGQGAGGPGPRGRARGDRAWRASRAGPARTAGARTARGAVGRRR